MTRQRGLLVLLAAVAAAVAAVWVPSTESHPLFIPLSTATLVGTAVTMLAFVAIGLAIWIRHPGSLIGPSLTAFGYLGMAYALLYLPRTFNVSEWLPTLMAPLLAQALLASPSGRLDRTDRAIVGTAWAASLALAAAGIASTEVRPSVCDPPCPRPFLFLADWPGVAAFAERTAAAVVIALFVVVAVRLVQRWRTGSSAARRALEPVMVALVPLVLLLFEPLTTLLGEGAEARFGVGSTILMMPALALVALGFVFGELRSRLSYGVVADLTRELERGSEVGSLQRVMQSRLRDPTLALGFWLEEEQRFIGADGLPFEDRMVDPASQVTNIAVDGHPPTVVVHDPAVDKELVEMIGSAAALAFQNEQLHSELLARLAEVQDSRARLVAAADDARRRVERDVHDGAQQRLVSLGMVLRLVEDRAGPRMDPQTLALLREARQEAATAVEELRDLTHGLYPALLTDAGLDAAVRRLADNAPMVVTVAVPSRRFAAEVEGCAYFVIAEALANATKHAEAADVQVHARVVDDEIALVVSDDGRGGATLNAGSGLRGLEDRVGAMGGRLSITSESGGGTKVEAWIPCV